MTDSFADHRPSLFALAYRILGTVTDAEDVLQETHVKWTQHAATVEHPKRWLEQVVTRLCLDQLKSARARREEYVGPWLPEPLETPGATMQGAPIDPEEVSLAFLSLLERLSPLERAVFVLVEGFDYSAEEAATVLGREAPAVRQLLHRARSHVQEGKPRFAPSRDAHLQLLGAFFSAVQSGDVKQVESYLAKDAKAVTDGGGRAKAALNVLHGAERVARFIIGVSQKGDPNATYEVREVNGWPAVVAVQGGQVTTVAQVETDGTSVFTLIVCLNPDKLAPMSRLAALSRPPGHD
jgi:RNA polymerase sigma-70 factor (ECF subfamily)